MKQLYDAGLPPRVNSLPIFIFVALILCTLLAGSGGTAADIAAVNSTAKTFPDRMVIFFSLDPELLSITHNIPAWLHYRLGHLWLRIITFPIHQRLPFLLPRQHICLPPRPRFGYFSTHDHGILPRSSDPTPCSR
jgi:hypothetical protein